MALVLVLILLVAVVLVRVMSPQERPGNLQESRWQMGDWSMSNQQRANWRPNEWPANNRQGVYRDNYVGGAVRRLITILALLNLALVPLCLYLAMSLATSTR